MSDEKDIRKAAAEIAFGEDLHAEEQEAKGAGASVRSGRKTAAQDAVEKVMKARSKERPVVTEYIDNIIEDAMYLAGDRCFAEDESVAGGIGLFRGLPVTFIGHRKGRDLEENIKCRFGMPNPEGYRKAIRLMKQAEKFGRPVIAFVDTPGAYPGKEAEERGQGQAIAECIKTMSRLCVPVVTVFTGEGGSGGALAFASGDRLIMLENSIFSILSPEGFASILWHDGSRWQEAAKVMKLTARDIKDLGVCDEIIPEPEPEEMHEKRFFDTVADTIWRNLGPLLSKDEGELVRDRYLKLRKTGSKYGRN